MCCNYWRQECNDIHKEKYKNCNHKRIGGAGHWCFFGRVGPDIWPFLFGIRPDPDLVSRYLRPVHWYVTGYLPRYPVCGRIFGEISSFQSDLEFSNRLLPDSTPIGYQVFYLAPEPDFRISGKFDIRFKPISGAVFASDT